MEDRCHVGIAGKDIEHVAVGVPVVNDHGQGKLSCQRHLCLKIGDLGLFWGIFFPIVVKSDLSYGKDLFMLAKRPQSGYRFFGTLFFAAVLGVDA